MEGRGRGGESVCELKAERDGDEISRARKWQAAGVAPSGRYVERMRGAFNSN